jgi:hypothetical protein
MFLFLPDYLRAQKTVKFCRLHKLQIKDHLRGSKVVSSNKTISAKPRKSRISSAISLRVFRSVGGECDHLCLPSRSCGKSQQTGCSCVRIQRGVFLVAAVYVKIAFQRKELVRNGVILLFFAAAGKVVLPEPSIKSVSPTNSFRSFGST